MANNDWIEGRYLRQRRNLNALSIILLIYVTAGGSLKSGAPAQLPGGALTITLDRPGVIIIFAWAALLYFMWRYWLASSDLRTQVDDKRKNGYHWTPYVRRIIENAILEHDLMPKVAHGSVQYKIGRWTLQFGQVHHSSGQKLVDVPDRKIPTIPFVFIAWHSEVKTALSTPEFSEYYTPFILAWLAIECSFIWPLAT